MSSNVGSTATRFPVIAPGTGSSDGLVKVTPFQHGLHLECQRSKDGTISLKINGNVPAKTGRGAEVAVTLMGTAYKVKVAAGDTGADVAAKLSRQLGSKLDGYSGKSNGSTVVLSKVATSSDNKNSKNGGQEPEQMQNGFEVRKPGPTI